MTSRLRAILLLVGAITLAPLPAGAAGEPGQRVRVTVDGGRVSVVADAAPVDEIVRAMADRTGIPITAINAGPLQATVNVEREPIEGALERVVRASIPAAHAATLFTYDEDDRLRAVKVIFRTSRSRTHEADDDVAAPEDPTGEPGAAADARLTDDQLRNLGEQLRRAGVPETHVDLMAADDMAAAGVPVAEIFEVLRTAALADGTGSGSPEGSDATVGAVMQPLSEAERQAVATELGAAGLPGGHLDEGRLLAARELVSGGVAMDEIVAQLRAVAPEPTAARSDDPATPLVFASVTGDHGKALSAELRQAGVPDDHLDESTLYVAQQLKAAGASMADIRENLAAIRASAGR